MKEFRRSNARIWRFTLFLNVLIIIAEVIIGIQIWSWFTLFFIVILNFVHVVTVLTKPIRIIINEETSTLDAHYFLSKKVLEIIVTEVECKFDYFRMPRGQNIKALRITKGEEIILELIPATSGFSDDDLSHIDEKLKELKNTAL